MTRHPRPLLVKATVPACGDAAAANPSLAAAAISEGIAA